MSYIDIDDIANRLGKNFSEAEEHYVSSLLPRTKAIIDTFTGRTFSYQSTTEYVDGSAELEYYFVRHRPLISVSSVTLDDNALTEDEQYWVYPDKGLVRFLAGILTDASPRNVVITYTYGFEEVPEDIKLVNVELVVLLFDRYRKSLILEGADSGSISDFQMHFELKDILPADLMYLLKQHRQIDFKAI